MTPFLHALAAIFLSDSYSSKNRRNCSSRLLSPPTESESGVMAVVLCCCRRFSINYISSIMFILYYYTYTPQTIIQRPATHSKCYSWAVRTVILRECLLLWRRFSRTGSPPSRFIWPIFEFHCPMQWSSRLMGIIGILRTPFASGLWLF